MAPRAAWPAPRVLLALAAISPGPWLAAATTPFVAALCKGSHCDDLKYPILDYDPDTKQCHCTMHPCWNNKGKKHVCNSESHKYLHFSYSKKKELECGCGETPQIGSVHVARDLCYGHRCDDPKFPLLDWDAENKRCVCSAHPCWNDGGLEHACNSEKFPVLSFHMDEAGKRVCNCKSDFNAYSKEL